MPHIALFALAIALASATPVVAEPAPEETDPAIGRLNHAGYRDFRHCTMFAIGPRTAITAAHCLRGLRPDSVHLLFGYARATWVRHLLARSAVGIGHDVVAICLSDEPPASLRTGHRMIDGETVTAVGYGRPVQHLQTRTRCRVIGRWQPPGRAQGRSPEIDATVLPDVVLDCAQSPGASGGPVLNEAGEVVAVVIQGGGSLTVATPLTAPFFDPCR